MSQTSTAVTFAARSPRLHAWLSAKLAADVQAAIDSRQMSKSRARKLGLLPNPYKRTT